MIGGLSARGATRFRKRLRRRRSVGGRWSKRTAGPARCRLQPAAGRPCCGGAQRRLRSVARRPLRAMRGRRTPRLRSRRMSLRPGTGRRGPCGAVGAFRCRCRRVEPGGRWHRSDRGRAGARAARGGCRRARRGGRARGSRQWTAGGGRGSRAPQRLSPPQRERGGTSALAVPAPVHSAPGPTPGW
jgi:hypothetical protein